MADVSWNTIIRNREAYPDEMVIDVNGAPIALGDLRNTAIPKEDMTRLTQNWSQRDQAARAQIDQLQAQLAQALTAANTDHAANTYEGSSPYPTNGAPLVDYERDPILAESQRQAISGRIVFCDDATSVEVIGDEALVDHGQ